MTRRAGIHRLEDGSFLTGTELTSAVRHVLGGAELRCAVAFWGLGAAEFIQSAGSQSSALRILCDVSMGGSHPDALRALGAPKNTAVRQHDGLHAKVFLSDRGVVIGSANASDNGLGFGDRGPGLLEAATFHAEGSKAWKAAVTWFEKVHDEAVQVDQAALDRAGRLYRPRREVREQRPARPGSLLDLVVAFPERFDGIGFVLASTSSTDEERVAARRSAKKAGIKPEVIDSVTDNDMFIGWDTDDVLRWPVSFIEFWKPKNKLSLYARTVAALDPTAGNVFARKDLRALRRLVTGDLPDFLEAGRQDAEIVGRLVPDGGRVFRTAAEFAAAIEAASL